ncbi:hypothetical protein GMB86_09175 [Terrilactibacillus sp. BCM23-1]|uniref:Uncharacterized protein n=1 Tax=Terrilactibacillus tamarindi TaxID=2599694 RepID=A0A6N8CT96_9BACI|nr:hypothetical protein [Terrilactibacillus tamarindi]MTT32175.1 hypothetical protein [Terrilactibacillus tamarindi]
MNQPKVYGSFFKRGDYTFRSSAYIQWGTSKKSLGSCLLLNPGSANFDKINPELGILLNSHGKAHGQIHADPTMGQLIKLVYYIYGTDEIDGRFNIYNLFALQDTQSEHAIDTFEMLVNHGYLNIHESLISINELKENPWILIGWGVKNKTKWTNFKNIKQKWMEQITLSKISMFGKLNHRQDYYHPCPQRRNDRDIILHELYHLYTDSLKQQQSNKERYTFLKWNGKYGNEAKFIVRNNWNNTQSVFIPGRCNDLIWFHFDLASDTSIKNWEPFGEESVDDLEWVTF